MTDENEKSRLNWARREAREDAISRLYEQAYTCSFDEAGRRAWDSMAVDEQAHFLDTGELPDDFEFSHMYSVASYPDMAHDSSTGYLTPHLDHLYGDHGGDTSIPLHGSPRDPDWRDSWGTQEIDATTPEGQVYLGMTNVSSDLEYENDDDFRSDLEKVDSDVEGSNLNLASETDASVEQAVNSTNISSDLLDDQQISISTSPTTDISSDLLDDNSVPREVEQHTDISINNSINASNDFNSFNPN